MPTSLPSRTTGTRLMCFSYISFAISRAGVSSVTVKDVMTRVVYAVRADDSVLNAVKLMISEDIHRAIVVTDEGSVVGIVTPMDVLRALATEQLP